ncbi:hypothetical protein EVAR_43310_1 [Eumeta japonica]|uniref:Uncharacterized protein n=1 Tax=Eumeta variegata TaxID=151549 RepID=A0A4C1WYC4_EUMVA|nr:hypothetical protein EVAR_43310_1 [Eumeta japonica]
MQSKKYAAPPRPPLIIRRGVASADEYARLNRRSAQSTDFRQVVGAHVVGKLCYRRLYNSAEMSNCSEFRCCLKEPRLVPMASPEPFGYRSPLPTPVGVGRYRRHLPLTRILRDGRKFSLHYA